MNPGGPGWNDPPALSYETHTQTTARRNLLTKRIGLPDLKLPSSDETAPPETLIKPPLDGILLPPPIHKPEEVNASDLTKKDAAVDKVDQESSKDTGNSELPAIFNPLGNNEEDNNENIQVKDVKRDTTDNLDSIEIDTVTELKNLVEKCRELNTITLQVSKTILKKIQIFEQQLSDQKLPKVVEEKMNELTKCLVCKNYDKAWNIHLQLMCDFSSNVLQWMVGVKRLITEAKKL